MNVLYLNNKAYCGTWSATALVRKWSKAQWKNGI